MSRFLMLFIAVFVTCTVANAESVYQLEKNTSQKELGKGSLPVKAKVLTFGDTRLVITDDADILPNGRLLQRGVSKEQLFVIKDMRKVQARTGYKSLYELHGYQLAIVPDPATLKSKNNIKLTPVVTSRVVVQKPKVLAATPDPVVQAVINQISSVSYAQFLQDLSTNFSTRLSCSAEILGAGDMIEEYFQSLQLETLVQPFNNLCLFYPCNEPTGYNIIGIKRGTVRPQDIYWVGAHYDSTSGSGCQNAPGSNDNASGTAGVMELARIFAGIDTEATVVFIAFSGEEQGLFGSRALLSALKQQGIDGQVKAFVVLDMISYYLDDFGVVIEGSNSNPYQQKVLEKYAELGATYTTLDMVVNTDYCCSDHEPFLDNGDGGSLFIEMDWSQYDWYHTTNDTFARQDIDLGVEITKLTGAILATGATVIPVQ